MKRLIIALIVLLIIIILVLICIREYHKTVFSIEEWEADIWGRYKMIDDLTQTNDLYGMSSAEILQLLGDNGLVEDSHYTYYVGKSFSGPILFNISFDTNDCVSDFGIIAD